MGYRNLLNFVSCLLLIFLLIAFVPFIKNVITILAVAFFSIKLAEWLMETTRKYFLHKRVSMKNKVVLITGCDTGFGNALARRMDKVGYSVLATCLDANGEGARKLSEDCSERLTVLPMDVTKEESIEKVKTFIEKNFEQKALWAVVNNAGIIGWGLTDWTSVEEFQRICDVNIFGSLRVTKAFLPFIKQSKGRIVNMNSIGGHYTTPGLSAYCVSKSGAVALTSALQMELPKWGVKSIGIEPFVYATPLANTQLAIEIAKKTFNAAPKTIQEDYDKNCIESFLIILTRAYTFFINPNISEVIDCLEDAITAEDPLPVYVPANSFHRILTLFFFRVLPRGMAEYLFHCIVNLGANFLSRRRKKKV